jgi:hypothetical protein
VIYLVGAPFSALFLAYVALVALSAFATIGMVSALDGDAVREQLARAVPARTVGAVLAILALLTLAQDAASVLTAARAGEGATSPIARPVWTADLALEVPVVLMGGVLLWRRTPLGYVAGAGLLVQYGLTPLALAASIVLQAFVMGSPTDVGMVIGVLVFGVVCFAPLAWFVRGTWSSLGAAGAGSRSPTLAISGWVKIAAGIARQSRAALCPAITSAAISPSVT